MKKTNATHESFDRKQEIKQSSNKSLGIVFAVFFVLVGVWPLIHEKPLRVWALSVGGAFLATALLCPKILTPLNKLWFKFGLLLHAIVQPIVLGLLFFLVVTPLALLAKIMGKDFLRLRFDKNAKTYWILRQPQLPIAESMKHQF